MGQTLSARPSGMTEPPFGRFYEVAGRKLLLYRSGDGYPAVVFLAGAGAVGLDYLNVQQGAARLTTSVLYDRAGTGWSERIRFPRTAGQVTDELRDLLRTAGTQAPYLLVGHSLGGLYARHYAQRFPGEVAGLVLLDPAHEDYNAYMPQHLNELRSVQKPEQAASDKKAKSLAAFARKWLLRLLDAAVHNAFGRAVLLALPVIRRYRKLYRDLFAAEMQDWPEPTREMLIEHHVSLEWLSVGLQEAQNVDDLYNEVRRAGPLPDVPLIVLCSMGVDDFRRAVSVGESESLLDEELNGKRRLYAALAASVPRGENRPVDGGHFTMHFRHPEAVLQAINDLLQVSRDNTLKRPSQG